MENGNGKDKILARLKKVLALAQSPNENEAARAMEKVQEILAEHNLSIADLEDKPGVVVDAGTRLEEAYPYRRVLATSVATMYFCTYYFEVHRRLTKSGGYNMDKHMFVGAPHDVVVARSMFDYLFKTVDRLSKEAADANVKNGGSHWSYMTSFRVACSQRLAQRIAKRIAEAKAGTAKASGGGNLPALASLYDRAQAANQDFLNQIPGMKSSRNRATVRDRLAAAAGLAAAENISLDAQVGQKAAAGRLR